MASVLFSACYTRKVGLSVIVSGVFVVSFAGCGGAGGGANSSAQATDTRTIVAHAATTVNHSTGLPQNDDYIHTYGHEAAGVERMTTMRLVKRYYAAAAAGDGATACSLLDRKVANAVPKDYGQTPANSGKTCAEVVSKIFRHFAGQSPTVLAHTSVTGIRLRGDQGFAQLRSSAMRTGEIALEREGREWKVAVLIGRACKNCAPG